MSIWLRWCSALLAIVVFLPNSQQIGERLDAAVAHGSFAWFRHPEAVRVVFRPVGVLGRGDVDRAAIALSLLPVLTRPKTGGDPAMLNPATTSTEPQARALAPPAEIAAARQHDRGTCR
jgi:hypothetical protein